MRKTIVFLLTLLVVGLACAQAPSWTKVLPKAGNSTYIYCCEYAIGNTENEARGQAIARILQTTAYRLGQPVESSKIFEAVEKETDVQVISRQFNIPMNKVCEYAEKLSENTYRVYVLCQVAVSGNVPPQWDGFKGCNDIRQYRNGIALVKSMFIPGLGQMGKRHYTEGALTLTSELILAGGGIFCYFGARNELSKMKAANLDYNGFVAATKRYDSYRISSYVIWGTAAALYIFNLCRAYTLTPNYKDNLVIYPSMLPTPYNNAYGIGITLNLK